MKKYIWSLGYAVILVSFLVYSMLDTFVIKHSYVELTDPSDTEKAEVLEAVITDSSYNDENISVNILRRREYGTDIYIADIVIKSPEYLKTALANDLYGRNITELSTSMSQRKNAIVTINGDFYGAREQGYVIRNGVLLRSKPTADREDLVIYSDGRMEIINESEHSAEELIQNGASEVLSFGPALILNSTVSVDPFSKVDKELVSNPRTAIGIIDELHYVFVVSDGRFKDSTGLSLYELANFMQSLGVKTAYNLDGGGSSTMCFLGKLVNRPTTSGGGIEERSVSDIVYIGY